MQVVFRSVDNDAFVWGTCASLQLRRGVVPSQEHASVAAGSMPSDGKAAVWEMIAAVEARERDSRWAKEEEEIFGPPPPAAAPSSELAAGAPERSWACRAYQAPTTLCGFDHAAIELENERRLRSEADARGAADDAAATTGQRQQVAGRCSSYVRQLPLHGDVLTVETTRLSRRRSA